MKELTQKKILEIAAFLDENTNINELFAVCPESIEPLSVSVHLAHALMVRANEKCHHCLGTYVVSKEYLNDPRIG